MKLSVIIPIYNEKATLAELVKRVQAVELEKELILVDDGSTDGTCDILKAWEADLPHNMKIIYQPQNRGKGAAIAAGLEYVTGDLVIIQDADLEYDPQDYRALVAKFKDEQVQVVYGSRNLRKNPRSNFNFYWGGRLLSWITNLLYGSHITDEATCYKLFRTDLLQEIGVESTGFEFCPEMTGKVLRRHIHIHEVPISYQPRLWDEGKKINWKDGLIAVWVLLKYRLKSGQGNGGAGVTFLKSRQLSSYVYLTLIILGAAALRLSILGRQSIAFDEGFSLAVGASDWGLLFRAILSDGVHPPFFYVLFKLALTLYGTTEYGARFFTAIFSLAGIPMIYALGKATYSERAGLAAAVLLTVNPLHIWLAQEARMYSLFSFLIILNFWFFWQILKSGKKTYWTGLAGTAALIYAIHYFGLLTPIIQFLFIMLTFRRHHKLLKPWSVSQLIAGLVLLPWLILTALREVKSFGIAFLIKPYLSDIGQTIWNMILGLAPFMLFIALPGLLIAGVGIALAMKDFKKNRAHLLFLLWSFVPPLLVWVMSQQRSFYADRYLSFIIPSLLLLTAYGLTQIKPRPLGIGLLAILAAFTLSSHFLLLDHPTFLKDNWRDAAQFISDHQQPDDIILLRSPHIQLPFGYYYHGPAEQKLASFNQKMYDVEALVDPHRQTWVIMPYTRRPTHYPMQPDTDESVWMLDESSRNLQIFVESNQDQILETKRFLGIQIWLIDRAASSR